MTQVQTPSFSRLAGVQPGSAVAAALASRQALLNEIDATHRALFDSEEAQVLTRADRLFVAAFVALLQGGEAIARHYVADLPQAGPEIAEAIPALWPEASGAAAGGPAYRVSALLLALTGPRLATVLEHAQLVALRPSEATRAHLERLLAAGLAEADVVLLAQLVGFVGFQVRLLAGLRSIARAKADPRVPPVPYAAE